MSLKENLGNAGSMAMRILNEVVCVCFDTARGNSLRTRPPTTHFRDSPTFAPLVVPPFAFRFSTWFSQHPFHQNIELTVDRGHVHISPHVCCKVVIAPPHVWHAGCSNGLGHQPFGDVLQNLNSVSFGEVEALADAFKTSRVPTKNPKLRWHHCAK